MGKGKIGWFCTYVPTEIIEAAGLDSYGIREDSGKGHDDVYLGDSICSYVRSCIGGALSGDYDFLDGVVISHSCECMRRLYDAWTYKQDEIMPQCIHFLDLPRVKNEKSIDYFAKNLRAFKKQIEKIYGEIPDESLIESIKSHNRTRDLLEKLMEIRKQENPPVTGLQAAEIIRKGMCSPRHEFNNELEKFVAGPWKSKQENIGPRIMLFGGPGHTAIIDKIEKAGGNVVCENTCNGTRYFDRKTGMDDDPIIEISRRYLGKTPCPRMLGDHGEAGIDQIRQMISDYHVDGVIYYTIKFCSNLQTNWTFFSDIFGNAVPVKMLEGDVGPEVNEREIHSFMRKLSRKSGIAGNHRGGEKNGL